MTTATPRSHTCRKQILFVDDDHFLLDGLRGALRRFRRTWEMRFVQNADDAIAAIATQPPDVVIADLRMPGTDGATLLELVRDTCPGAIRIVLSGYAEIKLVARAAAVAHRLIAKPCDTDELAEAIERSCALQDIAARSALHHDTIGASKLPAVPRTYAALNDVLGSPTAGASDVARVVEQDSAISAKVLQLANSAYFGRRSSVTSLSTAVAHLGMDVLRALVLQTEAFTALRVDPPIPGFDPESVQRHCSNVARLASELVTARDGRDAAFAAGLLHEIGLLLLASTNRDELAQILIAARDCKQHVSHVEMDRLGATHAEIGAYLLGLWGLPPTVTEAVARHHSGRLHDLPWPSVTALYVANALVEELEAQRQPDPQPPFALDLAYLEHAGISDQLGNWRKLAAQDPNPGSC